MSLSEHDRFREMFIFSIPQCDEEAFERYVDWLDSNPHLINVKHIETLLGEAYGYKRITLISMFNNLIRRHKIPTTKEGISSSAYFSQPIRNERMLVDLILERESHYIDSRSVPELHILLRSER